MNAPYRSTARAANPADACVFGISRTGVRSIDIIRDLARRLWPTKTAAELACRTGISQRSAEHWLGGRCGMSADALTRLLRSDAGLDFLEGLIGDAHPVLVRAARAAQLEAEAERLRLEIKAIRHVRKAR